MRKLLMIFVIVGLMAPAFVAPAVANLAQKPRIPSTYKMLRSLSNTTWCTGFVDVLGGEVTLEIKALSDFHLRATTHG